MAEATESSSVENRLIATESGHALTTDAAQGQVQGLSQGLQFKTAIFGEQR